MSDENIVREVLVGGDRCPMPARESFGECYFSGLKLPADRKPNSVINVEHKGKTWWVHIASNLEPSCADRTALGLYDKLKDVGVLS